MIIRKICLENFRNYSLQEMEVSPNINVFYGNNAQGKTNILEAIYYTALGRSFRTYKDAELIQFEKEFGKIHIDFEKNHREQEVEIQLSKKEKKTILLNGVKLGKNSELLGNLNIVLFSPDDIIILKQAPALRRRFLDILISQIKPQYMHILGEYNRVLEQRNALLKSRRIDTIEVWDEQIATLAEKIFQYRKTYIEKLGEKLEQIHPKVTNGKETIRILYQTKFSSKEEFLKLLTKNRELDLMKGFTNIGPHREDFDIYINETLLNVYGSQGQHRTAVLALKIAEMEILKDETLENPILLLDDVTSELDLERIGLIFQTIQDYQVFITCTDASIIVNNEYLTNHMKLYKILGGNLEVMDNFTQK